MAVSASRRLGVQVGAASECGRRDANEDYAAWTMDRAVGGSTELVAAHADGVGGAKGGRVAAECAVRVFLDAHRTLNQVRGVKRNTATVLEAINRWLHVQGRVDPALDGMACTFTALVLRGRQAHLVHVGDSRLYRLRDGELARLTTDHVPTRGAIRNVLTRALGAEPDIRIDYAAEPSRVHDRYLLCSDGVHGALSDGQIRDALDRRDSAEETARRLVEAAIASRLGDNATALVLDVLALPDADQPDLEAAVEALPIAPVPRTGAVVDGIELGAMLSDGQYSRVFRGVRQSDRLAVVLKFPKPVVGAEPTLRLAFLREFWIAARLSSPWVAEVIETPLEARSRLYTVMPYYEGETLERRLRRAPPVGRKEGLDIAIKLAKGVAALHRAGVVHRDIKPDNVVLQTGGALKLLDLGVARLPNIEDFPASSTPGTPSYMAPELFAAAPGDERTDLYALGVTLFRMFTGAYPYGEVEAFSKPRFTRAPAKLTSFRPDLPSWLDQVLGRLVAAKAADRYEDANEVIFALENGALQAAPSVPRPRGLAERDPLRFWQLVSAVLALLLLLAVSLRGR
jgi:serine/threonine protein phosphatase PrpC